MLRFIAPSRWLVAPSVVLALGGIGCAQPSPAQAPPAASPLEAPAALADSAAPTAPTSVAELQAPAPPQRDGGAEPVTTPAVFPDRSSIEALDRIAHGVLQRHDEHGALLGMPSDGIFETGSAELTGGARWTLDEIAAALAMQHGRRIHVRVYTDAMGDRAESAHLSQHRAETLRDYFVSRGVSADQIDAEGLGPARPVGDNRTADGRASNRRIEIVIETPRGR